MSFIDRLPPRIRQHEALGQFVRYALIGVLNTTLFVGLTNLLLWVGAVTLVASGIAYLVTNIVSFLLNKRWAFRDPRRERVIRKYLRFFSLTLVGLGLYEIVLHLWLIPLDSLGLLGTNLALLLALPVVVSWNFMSYRLWTFHAPDRVTAEA